MKKNEYNVFYNYFNNRIVIGIYDVSSKSRFPKFYIFNFLHKKRLNKLEYHYGGSSEIAVVFSMNHSPKDYNSDKIMKEFPIEFLSFKQFNNPTHPHAEVFNVLRKTKLFSSHQG